MQIHRHRYQANNVGRVERVASILAGALLFTRGLRTKGWLGTGTALIGIAFMRRGITGFCYTYQAAGISSAGRTAAPGGEVDESITINLPREEVYRFLRDVSNVTPVMQHVESAITGSGDSRSRWIVVTPGGKRIEWDAELVHEIENELIAWRSADGGIAVSGSIHFRDAAGDRGTEVRVEMRYGPPALDEDLSECVRRDLKRLKARIEAGVLPETEGQPAGARKSATEEHSDSDVVTMASEGSFPASDAPAYVH